MQDEIYQSFEGDNFFSRRISSNIPNEERVKSDLVLKLMKRNELAPGKVAEIGACNGFRLGKISREHACECVAFEPSEKAISNGKKKYPEVIFKGNIAAKLDAPDACFDIVIVYFVLHWVDRKTLLRSIAEIDRILMDGGYLILGDFNVPFAQKRKYHHIKEKDVWTYKQNYWDIFLETNLYELIDSMEYCEKSASASQEDIPRYCALMKKTVDLRYIEDEGPKKQ